LKKTSQNIIPLDPWQGVWYDGVVMHTTRSHTQHTGFVECIGYIQRVEQRKGTVMKANPEWIEQWQTAPHAEISVIIHTENDPRQYVQAAEAKGLSVIHVFSLTKTIAVRGFTQVILDLLEESWVTKIEPDRKITTMK
jgi:hypothetical protein